MTQEDLVGSLGYNPTKKKNHLFIMADLDFSEQIFWSHRERKEHYYISVIPLLGEFLSFPEVLKMIRPPYKSKSH